MHDVVLVDVDDAERTLQRSDRDRRGTAPAAVNAANEEAVTAFLAGRLPFLGIAEVVTEVLARHRPPDDLDLDAVLATERWSRDVARTLVEDLITTRGTR